MPVPGPTMMIGVVGILGQREVVRLLHIDLDRSPGQARSAR